MITCFIPFVVALTAHADINVRSIVYQPEAKLCRIVGPKIVLHHVPGTYFSRQGYDKFWVNASGEGMNNIVIRPKKLVDWRRMAASVGLDASHARLTPVGDPTSEVPLTRASAEILGLKGVPLNGATHKPWRVMYRESAVANHDRLHQMRAQIRAAQGSERLRLIRSCYDWYSEIDLRNS